MKASLQTDFGLDSNSRSVPAILDCESWILVMELSNRENHLNRSATEAIQVTLQVSVNRR